MNPQPRPEVHPPGWAYQPRHTPPPADLRAVGLSRCVACHKATGRKPPATSITRGAAA